MFYLVLVALIAIGTYAAFLLRLVPGVAEQRLGVLEELDARASLQSDWRDAP